MKKIYILGGGTFNHVRAHCQLATAAFGETARKLDELLYFKTANLNWANDQTQPYQLYDVQLILTKMANSGNGPIFTNEDAAKVVDEIIKDPETRGVIFNLALADFTGEIDGVPSGKYARRLETSEGKKTMVLTPAEKLIGRFRKERKDIFVVGFKTTAGADPDVQYQKALKLLKNNSLNLVIANDLETRRNMLVAPEETRYLEGVYQDRVPFLDKCLDIMLSRMSNTFTRSTVVPGQAVKWEDPAIPENLRRVVDHCIENGAYKPFLGKTAGHFAVKKSEREIITSIRKTNFNDLKTNGMVLIESTGEDSVVAHGFKPSVGGQSQRIIFKEHPEADCIVHFHSPPKEGVKVSVADQWPNECGSHQCGKNTSDHLQEVDLDGHTIKVVYLDAHGPNIVFDRSVPAEKIMRYIDDTFDLSKKTGGTFIN